MKISELIKTLQYELDNTGDHDIYISIATGKNDKFEKTDDIYTTDNIITSLDEIEEVDGTFKGNLVFGIRNWMM